MSLPSEARDWLAGRRPPAPPALRERIEAALASTGGAAGRAVDPAPGAEGAALAEALATAALERLAHVLASPQRGEAALDLLAADALLTYACEAAAEAGPDALVAFVHAFGPARLAGLVAGDS